MNKLDIIRSKFVIFTIQVSILSLFIFIFDYSFPIDFDRDITTERANIIQFIANYIMFDSASESLFGAVFIYLSWFLVGLVPIFLHQNGKKAYSMNLTTFFFPNFFFYIFLSRYSPKYYETNFNSMITNTILIGIMLVLLSLILSIPLKKYADSKKIIPLANLKQIEEKISSKCPHCGTEFDSQPIYCYNCSKKINETIETEH